MLSEKLGDTGFLERSLRHAQNHLDQFAIADPQLDPVQLEEDQGGCGTDAFVTIEEWMIPDEVKEIGGGHLEDVGMEVLARGAGARHGNGGLEQPEVPDAVGPAVSVDLIAVDLQDLGEVEEDRLHRVSPPGASGRSCVVC